MPNWTYLALHFLHTLALGMWVGGTIAIGALTAPAVFRHSRDRRTAGDIMATIFGRFEKVVFGCIGVLAVTSLLLVRLVGRFSPWYAIEYVCVAMMSASAIYIAVMVTPRLRELRATDRTGTPEFDRLHRASVSSAQFNLACGCVALFFS